jgi:hypothetical protein
MGTINSRFLKQIAWLKKVIEQKNVNRFGRMVFVFME